MRKMISGLLEVLLCAIALTLVRNASNGRVDNEFLSISILFMGVAILTSKLVEHIVSVIKNHMKEPGVKWIPLKFFELACFVALFFAAFYIIRNLTGTFCSKEIMLILSSMMTICHLMSTKLFDSVTCVNQVQNNEANNIDSDQAPNNNSNKDEISFLSFFRIDYDDDMDDDYDDGDDL